jgi:hypothetical protein
MSSMRSFRIALVAAAVVLAGNTLGCNDATNKSCPSVAGVFQAQYQQLEGSCPATFDGNQLNIARDDVGNVTKVETRLSDIVRTSFILKGCSIGMKQEIEAMGRVQSEIAGDLHVDSDAALSGQLMRTVYSDTGIACHGVYEAHFTRQDVVIGAATQAAQQ